MEEIRKILLQNDLRKAAIYNNISKSESLEGGKADNMTLEDIAEKHNISLDKVKEQFKLGVQIELEHTNDKKKAAEIVCDHLEEDCCYYTDAKPKGWAKKELEEEK